MSQSRPLLPGPRHARRPLPAGGGRHGRASRHVAQPETSGSAGSGLLRNSAVMALGTAASRLLGFVRTWLLSVVIGSVGAAADAFQLSNTLPNMIYMLTAGGILNAVLVPQIVQATRMPDGGRVFVNRLITWSLLIIGVVTVVMTALSPVIIPQMAKTHDPAFLNLAVAFAFWCVPQVLFYGLYTVFGQYLNAKGRFGAYMWAPIANNVVGLIGLGLFLARYGSVADQTRHPAGSWTPGMVALLAGTATLGIAVQALILLPSLRRAGFSYRPTLGVRGVGLGSASTVAGWTFLSVAAGQAAYVVAQWAATDDTRGHKDVAGIAAIAIAFLLMMLPHSLIGVSLVTALFTPLSAAAQEGDWDTIRANVSTGLRNVGLFNMLATAGLVALALPIAAVFSTTRDAATSLGWVIAARAIGLVFFTGTYLLQRVCFAYEDARTPFLTQIPGVILVIGGSLIAAELPLRWVAAAVSLVWSLASILNLCLTAVVLTRNYGSLDLGRVLIAHLRMLVAALVAGAAGLWLTGLVFDRLDAALPLRPAGALTIVVVGSIIVAIYLLGLLALRVPELTTATAMIRRRLGR